MIHKYTLNLGSNTIAIPIGAEILTAAKQRGALVILAKVDTSKDTEPRTFLVV